MEVWRDVVGYEGLYEVSNRGNVRSLNWRGTGITKTIQQKKHNRGYWQVILSVDGVQKTFLVHRLVANAFLDNPNHLPLINHKDENRKNNNAENLEWCSRSYNVRYSNHGGIKKRIGRNTHLQVEQVAMDGSIVATWKNSRYVFLTTGMSDWSISECCRGNRKSAYGYRWQYANYNSGQESPKS